MFYMWYCSKLNSKTNLLEPHCILPVLSTSKLSNQVQNDQKTYVGGGVRGGGDRVGGWCSYPRGQLQSQSTSKFPSTVTSTSGTEPEVIHLNKPPETSSQFCFVLVSFVTQAGFCRSQPKNPA